MFRPLQLPLALVLFAAFLCATSVRAAELMTHDDAARYSQCVAMIDRNPDAAFEEAQVWKSSGGGVGARHCEALALVALKIYGEAALRLGELADAPALQDPQARAAILAQAGNAWILEGIPENAVTAFEAALTLSPGNPDVLTDLARAHAAAENYAAAEATLDQVIAASPQREDAYVLRASARRAQGHLEAARTDVEQALAIEPGAADALVERGAIRLELGDEDGARADWLEVARMLDGTDPHGEDGALLEDARRYLEALDVNKPPA